MHSSVKVFQKQTITCHLFRLVILVVILVTCLPANCFSYDTYGEGHDDYPRWYGGYGERHDEYAIGIKDAIEINPTAKGVVALKAGSQPREIELSLDEQIRSIRTNGLVGDVITTDRILAISSQDFTWYSMPLELDEEWTESYLSSNLVLFISHSRAITFDSTLNRFITYDFPLGEKAVDQRVQPDIAVFVTLDRAVGYAAGSGEFKEKSFSAGEIFRDIEISTDLIAVVTSERILNFQASQGDWVEQERQ